MKLTKVVLLLVIFFGSCEILNNSNSITFSVIGDNGTITAKVGSTTINSGDTVGENEQVTFTATPDQNFIVKEWTVNGDSKEHTSPTLYITPTKDINVTVAFQAFIVGKWNIDKITSTIYVDGVLLQIPGFTNPTVQTNLGWIEFKEGGSGVDDVGDTFTWTLSGDNLTVTDDDGSFTMKLTTKEDEKIVGEWTETEIEDGVEWSVKMEIEMSKM